jgi:hypothetical protein
MNMRAFALAAVIGAGLTLGGVADARTWTDPAGRLVFDAPSDWVMDVQPVTGAQTIVLAGNANNECYVLATPNVATANVSPDRVRRSTDEIAASAWEQAANAITPMFPQRNAHLDSQSIDTSGFWPLRRAEFSGAERHVTAALTTRPGVELMALCWTYGGPDSTARYEAMFRSMRHPNDAAWQGQAEQQESESEAAAQAPAQPQQPAPTRRH